MEVRNSPLDQIASFAFKLAACVKGACVAGGASATVLGLGFGADNLLEQSGHPPIFKKAVGNNLGKVLSSLGFDGNSNYLELQKQIQEVSEKTKNIDELNKIINEMENNDSFAELKNDLKDFKEDFLKQLEEERKMKQIQQSKILNDLKNIKKN